MSRAAALFVARKYAKGGAVKSTKEESNYRLGTKEEHCAICTMFRSPGSCTAVQGKIRPQDTCDYFKRKVIKRESGGRLLDPEPLGPPEEFKRKTPRQRVIEGHQEFEPGYVRGWDYGGAGGALMNMRGQPLEMKRAADGGWVDAPKSDPESSWPPPGHISDEQLAQDLINAEAAKKYGPRQGGLMQTIPQAAEMVQTPEGRERLTEGARRWFTGDREGQEPGGWTPGLTTNPLVAPLIETVKGPREAMEGRMTPEQQAEWGVGTAMNLMGVGTFGAMTRPKGDIGLFGGRGAYGAPLRELEKAEAARASDIPEHFIWRDQGWTWDKANNPMFEIPTKKITIDKDFPRHIFDPDLLAMPEGYVAKLGIILKGKDADRLFKHYPQLKDILISSEDYMMERGEGATSYVGQNKISLSPNTP